MAIILCFTMVFTMTGYIGFGDYLYVYAEETGINGDTRITPQGNVHNVTQNKWYSTLSDATAYANVRDNDVIEVYKSFTETKSVRIQRQNLTIKAADGYNPTISWTKTDSINVSYATPYSCIVIYTDVKTSTTFGDPNGTGTLTFDASKASDDDNARARARVMVHCGSGVLNINDGVVLMGGNPGGGNYYTAKSSNYFPAESGEVAGETGFGAGIFMRYGTLNMTGGIIKDNYSLFGTSPTHNFVGGGGAVYLYGNTDGSEYTTMNMTGGTITHNAAGSGGGGGILVGFSSKLTVKGGTISENVSRFASGGGIGVRVKSEVKIQGGLIKDNYVEGHGGGLFARGDSIPLEITGGVFDGNVAGSYGGGILFWTVGDDVTKNTVKIGGSVEITNNKALDGGGISVGREVLDGKPIGNKAKLVIEGSPTISGNVAARNGGGIHMQSDEFSAAVNTVEISGGAFTNNEAESGAGIYVPGGTVNITGGSFVKNIASDRGAGIFTGGGIMTISNATFSENDATNLGGGAYVVNGIVNLNSGTLFGNTAKNGGAIYITGGHINMSDGTVEKNSSTGDGGALYITGGDFTMTSGKLIDNKSGNDTTLSNGGGAYVEEGNITIGVEGCNGGEEGTNHTHNITGKIHPIVKGNTATDSGGGIALIGNGDITMYCGTATENDATNRGRGLNIYMGNGVFNLYNGDVGAPTNPELVIVGGTLVDHIKDPTTKDNLTLEYYHCNEADCETKHKHDSMEAIATKGAYYNLPDGEQYWEAAENYHFFGWTFFGPNSQNAPEFVRNKVDYKGLGEEIKVEDTYDDVNDGKITMYALWAPDTSYITYSAVTLVDGEYRVLEDAEVELMNSVANNPKTYNFVIDKNEKTLTPFEKNRYKFVGWYIYQNEGQNANWSKETELYEPVYKSNADHKGYDTLEYSELQFFEADEKIDFGSTNFGDITLIAKFVPAYADLKVTKTGWNETKDPNQTFIFEVKGNDENTKNIDMTVTIQGNGSVIIKDLPVGKYLVEEKTEWSWRYLLDNILGGNNSKVVTITDPEKTDNETVGVDFKNARQYSFWLSGDSYCENIWKNGAIDNSRKSTKLA